MVRLMNAPQWVRAYMINVVWRNRPSPAWRLLEDATWDGRRVTLDGVGQWVPLDERDTAIREQRLAALDAVQGPRCGDYVRFSDGVTRRISHVWPDGVQTSDGGSWYLSEGYCSFSGGLYRSVPTETLTLTNELRDGAVWFFHHGHMQAHNGVDTVIPFRVYTCSEEAPE